jgi:hypothetical protein
MKTKKGNQKKSSKSQQTKFSKFTDRKVAIVGPDKLIADYIKRKQLTEYVWIAITILAIVMCHSATPLITKVLLDALLKMKQLF